LSELRGRTLHESLRRAGSLVPDDDGHHAEQQHRSGHGQWTLPLGDAPKHMVPTPYHNYPYFSQFTP
jgi:hypothetical protein